MRESSCQLCRAGCARQSCQLPVASERQRQGSRLRQTAAAPWQAGGQGSVRSPGFSRRLESRLQAVRPSERSEASGRATEGREKLRNENKAAKERIGYHGPATSSQHSRCAARSGSRAASSEDEEQRYQPRMNADETRIDGNNGVAWLLSWPFQVRSSRAFVFAAALPAAVVEVLRARPSGSPQAAPPCDAPGQTGAAPPPARPGRWRPLQPRPTGRGPRRRCRWRS